MRGKKVMAAQRAAGEACVHSSEKRRSGVEIIIECGDCAEVPGLGNPHCFRSALAAMQREGAPVAITLRSHIERRYGPAAAGTMGRISELLGKIDGLQAQLARDSGKGESCPGCVRPLSGRLSAVASGLRGMDAGRAVSMAADLESLELGTRRSACLDCAGITKVQVADIVRNLRELEKLVVQDAFNIVEGE